MKQKKSFQEAILMADILAEPEINIDWHADRILAILKASFSNFTIKPKIYPIDFVSKNERFNRDIFFIKSGLSSRDTINRLINFDEISKDSLKYFSKFFNSNIIIIGWELQKLTTDILDSIGASYINIWLHPVRFLEDEIFLLQTNNKTIEKKLQYFEIDESSFYVNASFVRASLLNSKKIYNLPSDSCVIFGQTQHDKTLRVSNGKLTLFRYKEHIEALCNKFNNIYFVSHPLDRDNKELIEFISSFEKINIINANAYSLLSSNNLKLVVAISSSVCTEAYYFGKNVLFFNQPICNIKAEGSYSIGKDIFFPTFWATLFNLEKNYINKNFIFNRKNQVRDILNAYYSYSILEEK